MENSASLKYFEGKYLSRYVSSDAPDSYSAAMLEVLRGDAKKQIKVKAPHTKKGYYYRTQEVSDKPQLKQEPTNTKVSPDMSKLIGVAAASLAVGGIVGGGIALWQSNEKTKQAVANVEASASKRVEQEVERTKNDLTNKYESELTAAQQKAQQDIEVATSKAREESATQFGKQIEDIQSQFSKSEAELRSELEQAKATNQATTAEGAELRSELERTRSQLAETAQNEAVLRSQLEATQQRAVENEGALQGQLERSFTEIEQERSAREQATGEIETLRQAQTRVQAELEAAQKLAEERIAAVTKEAELRIKDGIASGTLAQREELSKQQQELQANAKDLESTYKSRFKELDLSHAERLAELERTHRQRTEELERTSRVELDQRTREIEERINTEALKQIEDSRTKAIDEARVLIEKQIQDADDKRLAGATNPGKLISTEDTGIAIAASVRRGLDIEKTPRDSMQNRINDAIDKLAANRSARSLTDLAVDFKARAQDIRAMDSRDAKKKWQAMEHALIQQTNRENGVTGAISDIKGEYKKKHQDALSSFYDKIDGRGSYDADLIEQFDKKLTKLNKAMQKEITAAIEETRRNIALDQPFTGRPMERSDAWKTVQVKGTAKRKAYTRKIQAATKKAVRSIKNEVKSVTKTGKGKERDIKPALENIVTISASVAAPSWIKPAATAGTRIAMRTWRLTYDDIEKNGLPGLAEGISKLTPEQKSKMFKDGAVQGVSSYAGVTLSRLAPEVEVSDLNVGGIGAGTAGGTVAGRIAKKLLKTDAYNEAFQEILNGI